jgi:hypothetical protein
MNTPPRRDDLGPQLDDGETRDVSRYFVRERQKQSLRRERDVLVLSIARDIGELALAERLDVAQETVGRLVADARERLNAGSSPKEPIITARRLSRDPHRWAEIDTYYEALGARPELGGRPKFGRRRRASPQLDAMSDDERRDPSD